VQVQNPDETDGWKTKCGCTNILDQYTADRSFIVTLWSHCGNHKDFLANLSRCMMMLQTGGVAIFHVNRTSESRSTINIDFPPLLTDYKPEPNHSKSNSVQVVIRSSTKEHEGQEYTHERQLRLPCDRSMCGVASNRKGKQASRNDRHLEGLRNLTPRRACSAFMDKRANKGCIYSRHETKMHTLCRFRCNRKYFLH